MRAVAALALLVLGACGPVEESTTIGGTTFSNEGADGTATISNERGSISASDGAAAANTEFPAFAPQYPGSTVESALVTNTASGERTMATLVTDDEMAKVVEFYRDKFTEAGLEIGTAYTVDDSAMLSAEGGGKKASVTGGKQDGRTSFALSFSGL